MKSYRDQVALDGPSFSVKGEGTVVIVPDIAQFVLGIITEGGENIAELQEKNSDVANGIISFLKESGISEEDIKTKKYNPRPRYQHFSCFGSGRDGVCPSPEIMGYIIDQSVGVRVRNLDDVVDNGANPVSQPAFTVDDPIETEN